jgi:hypothetical protein
VVLISKDTTDGKADGSEAKPRRRKKGTED